MNMNNNINGIIDNNMNINNTIGKTIDYNIKETI